MTNFAVTAALLALKATSAADYFLAVTVITTPLGEPEDCHRCGEAPCQVVIGYSQDDPCEGDMRSFQATCLGCVIPFVDGIDYLNVNVPIEVEVFRDATNRPF